MDFVPEEEEDDHTTSSSTSLASSLCDLPLMRLTYLLVVGMEVEVIVNT